MEIFRCFSNCNADQNCTSACYAAGDANAQAAASASLQCVADCNSSVDENCVTNSCNDQIEACRAIGPSVAAAPQPGYDPEPGYAPQPGYAPPVGNYSADRSRQPVTQSGVLAWLTGDWIGNNHQFQFFGDGRVRRSSGTPMYTDRGTYGCVSLINETGTVTQEGDYLIMNFDAAQSDHCRNKETGPAATVRYLIDWKENYMDPSGPLQIIIREQNCTRGGTMYCDDPLRRR